MPSLHLLLLSLLLSSLPLTSLAHTTLRTNIPAPLALSTCTHATYPSLCQRTLASSAARTPTALARDGVSVSLASARAAHAFLLSLPSSRNTIERAAARDCAAQLAGAVAQLARTTAELGHLRPATLQMQLQNAQTWTSAALTNANMCLDALRGISGPTAATAAPKVTDASESTSNALYLVNRCATISSRHH